MIKRSFIFIFVLFFAAGASAQQYRLRYSTGADEPISLENAIRLALENNYDLLLTEQDVIIAEQRVKEAKYLYLPQLSLNANATAYNLDYPAVLPENLGLRFLDKTSGTGHKNEDLFYAVGVQATQYLYTGGRTSSTVSLANATLKEALSRYEAVKSSIIYRAKEAFFEYLYLQHKEAVVKEAYDKAQTIIGRAREGKWQQVLVKAEMASLTEEADKTAQEVNAAHLNLLGVLNKELNAKVSISGSFEFEPLDVDLEKITLWAMEYRPELKSALYKLEMDNIAVNLSLAKRYPDILLGVGYDRLGQDSLRDENFQITLGLSLPIGFDYATQLKQKRAEQRQTTLRRAAIEDAIRLQVRSAYNNLSYWQAQAQARRKDWEAIREDFKNIDKSGLAGEDVVKAFEYYYKTGVGYLEAVKRHLLCVAELELAVGQDIRK
ncbi:MAG: TolC family protein [Elusimicrobiota bacterium]|nr:TolC family protein [Elusimicrobiota bacterium]